MSFVQEIKKVLVDGNPGHRWERLTLMAKIEFKLRYYESKLGLLWALLKPLFQVAIYYVAFKLIMKSTIENYALYLFSGIIVYQFFTESTSGVMNILKTKKYLYEYSNMSKFEIYFSNMLSISIGFAFNLIVVTIALVIAQIPIGFNLLWIPLLFIELFFISFGIGLIISNLVLYLKDIRQVWPLVTTMLFWISPIFFRYDSVREALPFLDYVNPIAGVITNFRHTLFYNESPEYWLIGVNFIHSILFMVVGLILLNRLGKRASEIL